MTRPIQHVVALVIVVLLATPAVAQSSIDVTALDSYTEHVLTGFINWGEGFAQVEVKSTYDTERFGSSHAKIRAIEEAEKQAEQALYRLLRGVNIDGSRRLAGTPELEAALRDMIGKRRKMESQHTTNVTMQTVFEAPIFGKKALAHVVHQTVFAEEAPGSLATATGGTHTSVVFDASSTSLQAALFPRVFSATGDLLYGPGNLDRKGLERGAPVTYLAPTQETGKKAGMPKTLARRLGDNPLIIKVDKITGDFLADIELRPDQEEKLRAGGVSELLAMGQVFVLQTASVDSRER